jgi:hypothetical protein
MNKEEITAVRQALSGAAKDHNEKANALWHNWVGQTITILGAALALLAGFSGSDPHDSCVLKLLYLSLYPSFAASLLTGAFLLRYQEKSHILSRDKLYKELKEHEIPDVVALDESKIQPGLFYLLCYHVYPWLFSLSVILLSLYGIIKNI